MRPIHFFHIHGPDILHCFFELQKYHKIIQIQTVRSQQLIRSFAKLKENMMETFF